MSWRHSASRAGRLLAALVGVAVLLVAGCISRTAGPQLPYVKPAFSVPNPDASTLHIAGRVQELEAELQRLRELIERSQASGEPGGDRAIRSLQERVAFIERQLGFEPPADAARPVAPPQAPQLPPQPRVQPGPLGDSSQMPAGPRPAVPGAQQQTRVEISDTPLPADEKLYRDALALLRRGSADEAAPLFEEFLKKYPKSQFVPDALYWFAQARMAQGRHDEAVLQLDRVIKEFPGSKKELSALLKQGEAFAKMGDQRSARIIFQKLVNEHPHTPQARVAATKLKGNQLD